MNIAFDAKRAYHNHTGLGHYSRTLINSLAENYPTHQYFLCNPKPGTLYQPTAPHVREVNPRGFLHKNLNSVWRSNWVKKDLKRLNIDLYHGLSHEIPVNIHKTSIKSVVTIHDLIHERYPEQYNKIDVQIYRKKFKYACHHADHIIAISKQTKQDIIDFYKIAEDKISICYQSCNPAFAKRLDNDVKQAICRKYALPDKYYLYVGSVIERKNLLTICKAFKLLGDDIQRPLVVIGTGGDYFEKVKIYVSENGLKDRILFLSEHFLAYSTPSFRDATDFPAIYQNALAMIYPSTFEGFGIPVLEALWSRIPVITSNVSCLPEAGGDGALLINPLDEKEMAEAIKTVTYNMVKKAEMLDAGWQHAHQFTNEKCAAKVMEVYEKVMHTS
jgi:glycosyltransferase involved in cell wall biosynthesis